MQQRAIHVCYVTLWGSVWFGVFQLYEGVRYYSYKGVGSQIRRKKVLHNT